MIKNNYLANRSACFTNQSLLVGKNLDRMGGTYVNTTPDNNGTHCSGVIDEPLPIFTHEWHIGPQKNSGSTCDLKLAKIEF